MPTQSVRLPGLASLCEPFELRSNPHCCTVTAATKKWALDCLILSPDERDALPGLKLGLLASLCYPTCDMPQLQLVTKFLLILLHWADVSPTSVGAEPAFQSIWSQLLRAPVTEYWRDRFQRHLAAFRVQRQRTSPCTENEEGAGDVMHELVVLRRDSIGVMACLDLIEYAEGLDIPDEVYNSRPLQQLTNDVADIVSWANDIVAYVHKHDQEDGWNLVKLLMRRRNLTLQKALEVAGEAVKKAVNSFLTGEQALMESTPVVDQDVRRYVRGLRDMITGYIHWAYETERFFGENGEDVRTFGWVFLQA